MESTQMKLSRVRKPRVHIVYEVETEGATVEKELPFVVGVLGDFSGNAGLEQKPLPDRKFVQIDRDNFDEVMTHFGPGLAFSVENVLVNDGSQMGVELHFNQMADFEPANVIAQIKPLKDLLDIRNKIRDLSTKVDRSDDLEKILESLLQDQDQLKNITSELGLAQSPDAPQT